MKKAFYVLISLIVIVSITLLCIKYLAEKSEKERQEWINSLTPTASKNVKIIPNVIPLNETSQKRTLAIYLPENYDSDTMNYSVFYFLDGQSIYDEKILLGNEWQVDEVLDSLAKLNKKAIAVGIYNSENRDSEYQPNFNSKEYDKRFTGNLHAEWIVKAVKPWVDKNYRTKQDAMNTVIGGASYGGLMSYYMLTEYPNIFGGAIIMSPSFWVNEKSTELDKKVKDMEQQYIYLSAGGKERGIINGAKHLNKVLLNRGLDENYRFEIEKGEIHRNLAWRKMIKKSIPWMLDRMKEKSVTDK